MLKTGRPKYKTKPSNFSEVLARRVPPLSRAKRKLEGDFQRRVCVVIAAGYTLPVAAAMFGCSRQAIHQLAQRDPEFSEQLKKANEDVKSYRVKHSLLAVRGPEWAANWLLERLRQEEGGRKKNKPLTDEERAQALEVSPERFDEVVRSRTTRRLMKEELRRLAKEDAEAQEAQAAAPAKSAGRRS